jgi:hypothetical protein
MLISLHFSAFDLSAWASSILGWKPIITLLRKSTEQSTNGGSYVGENPLSSATRNFYISSGEVPIFLIIPVPFTVVVGTPQFDEFFF